MGRNFQEIQKISFPPSSSGSLTFASSPLACSIVSFMLAIIRLKEEGERRAMLPNKTTTIEISWAKTNIYSSSKCEAKGSWIFICSRWMGIGRRHREEDQRTQSFIVDLIWISLPWDSCSDSFYSVPLPLFNPQRIYHEKISLSQKGGVVSQTLWDTTKKIPSSFASLFLSERTCRLSLGCSFATSHQGFIVAGNN